MRGAFAIIKHLYMPLLISPLSPVRAEALGAKTVNTKRLFTFKWKTAQLYSLIGVSNQYKYWTVKLTFIWDETTGEHLFSRYVKTH